MFDALTGALLATFDDPSPTTSDQFGITVALDGNNVFIGSPQDDTSGTDVGQALLFSCNLIVPEPSSFALGMSGLLLLTLSGRRRRRRKSLAFPF